ncbi:hypothetical protein [Alkalicoccus daliensis]|uniref:Uncharacterized protein n=1 Tax=Alkalicoccus daliensis TaxID=745820 RepID=A0A1H0BD66_9BACI|nr:hypothetical protein [Alkalicoccus daliensis]SDN43531.1 hypothetical protein SAMN04488053_101845 [Alkalicoccus daliensis]
MENLISLLLDSPLLLFFILAAIFSFIQSRSGSSDQEAEGRTNQPQTYEQGEEVSSERRQQKEFDWKDILFEGEREAKQEEAPQKSEEPANNQTEMQKHYEKVRKRQREAEKSSAKVENSPITRGDITKTDNSPVDIDFSNMSKQDIVKGIVWSEVLGKPKARQSRR